MAEMGLSARTRENDGGTARTLAGSVRDYAIHYTGIVGVPSFAPYLLFFVLVLVDLEQAAQGCDGVFPRRDPVGVVRDRQLVALDELLRQFDEGELVGDWVFVNRMLHAFDTSSAVYRSDG
jgi:hypothetical protein